MSSPMHLLLFALVLTFSHLPFTSCDFLAPLLSPVISNICKQVGCGKGKCKMPSSNSDFQYECECDPGWRQMFSTNSTPALKFLPCVIPNCTLNYQCSEDAAPAPSQATPLNGSIFEPCHWAICGGGVCNKTSGINYECNCKEGYSNLFNNTAFPCFHECSIGGNCSNLGITVSNNTSPPPNLPDTGSNQARSVQKEDIYFMVALLISVAVVL